MEEIKNTFPIDLSLDLAFKSMLKIIKHKLYTTISILEKIGMMIIRQIPLLVNYLIALSTHKSGT